ncbi:MAG: hypothetical protein U1F35_04660 [Steroidobacteraceae bacterium]
MDLALQTMRAAWGADEDTAPGQIAPEIKKLTDQIAELERLVQAGVLSPVVAAPSIDQAERQRRALLSAGRRRPEPGSPKRAMFGAEAAYRDVVARMAAVLAAGDVQPARGLLHQDLGDVPVRPARRCLEAKIRLNFQPLVRAVSGSSEWIGSGGRI